MLCRKLATSFKLTGSSVLCYKDICKCNMKLETCQSWHSDMRRCNGTNEKGRERARHDFHMQQHLTFQDCKSANENKNEFIGHTTSSLSRHLTIHVSNFSVIRKHLKMQIQLPLPIRKILIDNTEIMKRFSYKKCLKILETLIIKKNRLSFNGPFFEWGQVQKIRKRSTKNEITTTKKTPFTQQNI